VSGSQTPVFLKIHKSKDLYIVVLKRPVETGTGAGEIKNDGEDEFSHDILRSFVNVTMYTQYNNLKNTALAIGFNK
jgi:hypothetical protein